MVSEESEGWRWCPGDLRSEEESPREDRLLNLGRRRRGQGGGRLDGAILQARLGLGMKTSPGHSWD